MESGKMNINGMQIDMTELLSLLAQNKKLEAIKLLKDTANLGLKEAKDFVESIEDGKLKGLNIDYKQSINVERNEEANRVDLAEILKLIEQGKKIEAVKLVYETEKIGLKEAKETVDSIEAGNWDGFIKPTSKGEKVNIEKNNGNFKVTYTDNNGIQSIVTPADHRWTHIKKIFGKDNLLKEYEDEFNKNKSVDYGSSVFVEEKGTNWKLIAFVFVVLILIGYYFFSKFLH